MVGDPHQQDTEIAAFFKDAEMNYGERKVLGILATRNDEYEHGIYKRQAEVITTQEPTTTTSPDEPIEDNFIYVAKGLFVNFISFMSILKFIKINFYMQFFFQARELCT